MKKKKKKKRKKRKQRKKRIGMEKNKIGFWFSFVLLNEFFFLLLIWSFKYICIKST